MENPKKKKSKHKSNRKRIIVLAIVDVLGILLIAILLLQKPDPITCPSLENSINEDEVFTWGITSLSQQDIIVPSHGVVVLEECSAGLCNYSWIYSPIDGLNTIIPMRITQGDKCIIAIQLEVNNLPPTAILAIETINNGQFRLSATNVTDVSQVDTLVGFTYTFDCDTSDNVIDIVYSNTPSFDCNYETNGSYEVSVQVADKDITPTTELLSTIAVQGVIIEEQQSTETPTATPSAELENPEGNNETPINLLEIAAIGLGVIIAAISPIRKMFNYLKGSSNMSSVLKQTVRLEITKIATQLSHLGVENTLMALSRKFAHDDIDYDTARQILDTSIKELFKTQEHRATVDEAVIDQIEALIYIENDMQDRVHLLVLSKRSYWASLLLIISCVLVAIILPFDSQSLNLSTTMLSGMSSVVAFLWGRYLRSEASVSMLT